MQKIKEVHPCTRNSVCVRVTYTVVTVHAICECLLRKGYAVCLWGLGS